MCSVIARVLHLHPRGLARYPEGDRWREDEPSPAEVRVRAMPGSSPMDSGLPPRAPRLWARRPCFPPPCVLRGRGKSSPCTPSQAATAPCHVRATCRSDQRSATVTRALSTADDHDPRASAKLCSRTGVCTNLCTRLPRMRCERWYCSRSSVASAGANSPHYAASTSTPRRDWSESRSQWWSSRTVHS